MIPRQIRSRAVDAFILFVSADPDYASLCTVSGVLRIFRQPYDELKTIGLRLAKGQRQMHIYAGASSKSPGVGSDWTREFEVIVEYYSPRNEETPAIGDP